MHSKSFDILSTAKAAEIDISRLRNWLRQDVIKYCGDEPRPSYPRMFPLAGVYEIAILREMVDSGFDRAFASRLVRSELAKWQSLVADEDLGALFTKAYKQVQTAFESYRDLEQPVVWVFGSEASSGEPVPHGPYYATGFADVEKQIARLQKCGKPYLLKSCAPGETNVAAAGQPFHSIGVLNVTAILARVDSLLSEK